MMMIKVLYFRNLASVQVMVLRIVFMTPDGHMLRVVWYCNDNSVEYMYVTCDPATWHRDITRPTCCVRSDPV